MSDDHGRGYGRDWVDRVSLPVLRNGARYAEGFAAALGVARRLIIEACPDGCRTEDGCATCRRWVLALDGRGDVDRRAKR